MRYCFTLQVRPDRLDEYVERHRSVWPDMQAALQEAGWGNYSLFLRAQRAMDATDVNRRWQAEMAEFFTGTGGAPPDRALMVVPEVFHLDSEAV